MEIKAFMTSERVLFDQKSSPNNRCEFSIIVSSGNSGKWRTRFL